MGKAAVDIAKAIEYDSVGTIEFLVDKNMNFYFLEMNTRIQVEHPVTEMVTGIDLIREQILVAANNELTIAQKDIKQTGHAIEARIYAEEPENDFRPSPGDITYYRQPDGLNLRIDAAIDSPATIHSFFDPMISKLIAYGESREIANERLNNALKAYIINGIKTNIPFLIAMIQSSAFCNNNISTKFCDNNLAMLVGDIQTRIYDTDINNIIASYIIFNFKTKQEQTNNNLWKKTSR